MIRTRLLSCLLFLLPAIAFAQALDPSTVTLNAAAAEKFVRATQAMAASGEGPNMQGGNAMDLAKIKSSIDGNAAAQKALAAAGFSSTDYVLFLGAAMQSMMVGQMEAAGVRNMLPPGVTKRPSQANIDFMKANLDMFQRAMTPGAPAAANSGARLAANTSDEALPMPKDAGAVLPSSILAKIPSIAAIDASTDCSLGDIPATIDRERAKAAEQQAAYYGNPGNSGLGRTPAERAVLDRLEDSDIEACGSLMSFASPLLTPAWRTAQELQEKEMSAVALEESEAWNACPGIAGGKDPECERAISASSARKIDAIQKRYLTAITPVFDGAISELKACTVKREAIVKEAHAANVTGANVKLVLRPLVLAWEVLPTAAAHWTAICEDAQRGLLKK
jgi:hypothetical protein